MSAARASSLNPNRNVRGHAGLTVSIAFAVGRSGEWSYVAWEAPSARSPRGRLWLSDGAGLRAFEL